MTKVLNYIPKDSVVHKITGKVKLVIFLSFSFLSAFTYDMRILLGLLIVCVCFFVLSKIKLREIKAAIYFLLAFMLINGVATFLFDPNYGCSLYGSKHVLFHIAGKYDISIEQLYYQSHIFIKFLLALPLAVLFISTTNPSELAASLNSIGISYKISYTVSLALRYIPDIQQEYHDISQAQQARGIKLGKKVNLLKRFKNVVNIMFPLIFSSISKIETISNAMDLRRFGQNKKRTWYEKKDVEKNDYVVLIIGLIITSAIIYITIRNGSRFYNPFI